MDRRKFLSCSLCSAAAVLSSPLFGSSLSYAQSLETTNSPLRFLFFVFLQGGMDPFSAYPSLDANVQAALQAIRGPLTIGNGSIIPLASSLGLHAKFQPLLDALVSPQQELKLFAGVGSPSGDRSHFNATSELGRGCYGLNGSQVENRGWLARLIDAYQFEKGQVYSVGSSPSEFFLSQETKVYEVPSALERLKLGGGTYSEFASQYIRDIIRAAPSDNGASIKGKVRDALKSMDSLAAELGEHSTPAFTSPAKISSIDAEFIRRCSAAGELANYHVNSGRFPKTMVSAMEFGSFDTHQNLVSALLGDANNYGKIGALASGLATLITRLKSTPLSTGENAWDRSAIMVFSEFGRQLGAAPGGVIETMGVDHGYGTNYMLLSGAFKAHTPVVMGTPISKQAIDNRVENAWVPTMNSLAPIAAVLRGAGYDPAQIFPQNPPSGGKFVLPGWQEQEPEGLFV